MQFKVGQTVILMDRVDMNALIGSEAVIEHIDEEFLYVMWITPQTQSDGAYYPFHFTPKPARIGEQLLFSFMDEQDA